MHTRILSLIRRLALRCAGDFLGGRRSPDATFYGDTFKAPDRHSAELEILTCFERVHARHERCSRRCTEWLNVVVVQNNPVCGQSVHVRSRYL